jgi:hypothetical protein
VFDDWRRKASPSAGSTRAVPDFKLIGLPDGLEGGEQGRNVVMETASSASAASCGSRAWSRVFHDGKPVELKPVESRRTTATGSCAPPGKKDACVVFEKGGRMCESLSIGGVVVVALRQGARRREVRLQEQRVGQRSAPPARIRKGWEVKGL